MAEKTIKRGELLKGGDRAKLQPRAAKFRELFDGPSIAWTAPSKMQVRITDVETADNSIAFFVEGKRLGKVVYSESHVIVNPPTMVVDGTDVDGKPAFKEDTAAVLREIVEEYLR